MSASVFRRALAELQPSSPSAEQRRRWVYVPYDQLTDAVGPLSRERPEELGIVLVESSAKAGRRPYHQQKLALVLANGRHFALEQAKRGVAVRHVFTTSGYAAALGPIAAELGPLRVMRPAERELRHELAPLFADGTLVEVPHEGFLTTAEEFRESQKSPPYRLDAFYRFLRQRRGILMDGRKPRGGAYSFDGDNRRPYRGKPAAPPRPTFPRDAIKDEVVALVRSRYAHHPGVVSVDQLAATRADAEASWAFAREACLPTFGPFEDAMARDSRTLFHSVTSHLLNLQRLSAHRMLDDVLALAIDLPSQEGFVRQLLGWREFVRHVHEATDGFRRLEGIEVPVAERPGDGGFGRWRGEPWQPSDESGDGGAMPSVLATEMPLPPAFWGTPSGLACLDTVVRHVWEDAYSHHITRLMVLANVATLLGVSPRELTDWFWVAYHDAYDWVVEPNVLAMGTFGAGDVLSTKPYVSGAAYIHKMSDYCASCAFDPKTNCPITRLYWSFLARNEAKLRGTGRVSMPLVSLSKRSSDDRAEDEAVFRTVRDKLTRGERVD
jgi:deoxyribodipyrimidine photolyase-related protein